MCACVLLNPDKHACMLDGTPPFVWSAAATWSLRMADASFCACCPEAAEGAAAVATDAAAPPVEPSVCHQNLLGAPCWALHGACMVPINNTHLGHESSIDGPRRAELQFDPPLLARHRRTALEPCNLLSYCRAATWPATRQALP